MKSVSEAEVSYKRATRAVDGAASAYERARAAPESEFREAKRALDTAIAEADAAENELVAARVGSSGRERVSVSEPDLYSERNPSFLQDLYRSQLKGDPGASERIARHQQYEVEKRAIATGTLGGIIPPQYMVDMYARAARNGRVYADQVRHEDMPEEGQSLVVPRLTQGTGAGVQASENNALTTQDVTELDLTVPVRTAGGYIPVSRQTLERSSYSEGILFEDLLARYNAAVDVDCLSGSGSSGHVLGVLNTAGILSSVAGAATMTSVWPKIADVIQQINTAVGGLGYVADKIVMHPRRWGWFESQLDSSGRPVFGINGMPNYAPSAEGVAAGYGYVGRVHGLPVFTDANIPTNFHTDEDVIIVMASPIVHLYEDPDGPTTLAFEQQNGTALQVQLIAYGYLGFTAGRYPAATGLVYGAGLVAPTFGS